MEIKSLAIFTLMRRCRLGPNDRPLLEAMISELLSYKFHHLLFKKILISEEEIKHLNLNDNKY